MKLEEAIKHLEEELKIKEDWSCVACKEDHEQLLKWLKELQAIKSAEPSEAIDCLRQIGVIETYHRDDGTLLKDSIIFKQEYDTIKNYILKEQEQEKILNSIKEKIIWVENDKLMCGRYADTEIELEEEDFENKEEFNLLKRYF